MLRHAVAQVDYSHRTSSASTFGRRRVDELGTLVVVHADTVLRHDDRLVGNTRTGIRSHLQHNVQNTVHTLSLPTCLFQYTRLLFAPSGVWVYGLLRVKFSKFLPVYSRY